MKKLGCAALLAALIGAACGNPASPSITGCYTHPPQKPGEDRSPTDITWYTVPISC